MVVVLEGVKVVVLDVLNCVKQTQLNMVEYVIIVIMLAGLADVLIKLNVILVLEVVVVDPVWITFIK